VTAFLADLTRPQVRTRAMFAIGISIGSSFVLSLVAGPMLAAAIGVAGVFWLIGGLGLLALALVAFALPPERPAAARAARGEWRAALTRPLAPYYGGVFVLHLSLTAAFIAVPHLLRDLHGLQASRHWLVYLGVFAGSVALTVPLVLWAERGRRAGTAALGAGLALAVALAALAMSQAALGGLLAALVVYFGAFNFLEARLPAALTEVAGERSRGAALGVFATAQFAGAFAGGLAGGALLGSPWQFTGVFTVAAFFVAAWLPWARATESR
jgi:predicted MFS family arabinose efflux permease